MSRSNTICVYFYLYEKYFWQNYLKSEITFEINSIPHSAKAIRRLNQIRFFTWRVSYLPYFEVNSIESKKEE